MKNRNSILHRSSAIALFATLVAAAMSVVHAGAPQQWVWSATLNNQAVPGTFATKQLAVQAMKAYGTTIWGANSPVLAGVNALQESPISSVTPATQTYKYTANTPATSGDWTCYQWAFASEASRYAPTLSGQFCYPDEASAVAAETSMPGCTPGTANNIANDWVAPDGGWSSSVEVTATDGTLIETTSRGYDVWNQLPTNNCATTGGPPPYFVLFRNRPASCPTGFSVLGNEFPSYTVPCADDAFGTVTGQLLQCPQNGSAPTTVGDPCDVATGDFFQTEADYSGAGLDFTRYYHSATLESHHALGVGWTHTYAAYLILTNGTPTGLLRPDGHTDAVQNIDGEYESLSGFAIHVQQSGSNWVAYTTDGSSEVYSNTGQLLQEINPAGQVTTLAYNASNQLTSVTGPFGHSLQFAYDASGRLTTVTEPDGQSTVSFVYDGNNNLISATYPDSSVRQYLYEDSSFPNSLTGILDEANSRFLTVQYDSSTGAVISSQQAGGAQAVSISYGAASAVVIDALGATNTYTFTDDPYAPHLTALQRNNVSQSFVVPYASTDPQRRVTQSTDENGNVTVYTYDTDHLTSKTEAYGTPQARTTSYQYLAPTSALPTLITEQLRQTAFAYYSGTNLVHTKTVTDTTATPNVSRTWTYTYDSDGRVLTIDGPRTDVSDVTTYTYYTCESGGQCGQLQSVTDAVGHVTTYTNYNAYGQPLTIADANGVVTTITYDARQRVTSRSTAGETTSFTYYPTGLLKTVTLPDSSALTYTYDGAHRVTQITDSLGNQTSYTLDGMGNRIAETTLDPDGVLHRTHSRVFNALNELYQDVNAAGTAAVTTTYSYDNDGNQTSIAAPLGRTTAKTYDPLNRLSQITDAANGVTQFSYDADNNLTSVLDPRQLTTSYVYSGFGDLNTQSSPDTGGTTNTYDSAGNISTATDARGAVANYSYDALNRVQVMAYSLGPVNGSNIDQAIGLIYDNTTVPNGVGRLSTAADQNVALLWQYDALGRVIQKSQIFVTTAGRNVAYAYSNDDLTSLTTPSGQVIGYSYTNHQVTGITINGTPLLSQVTYFPFGPTFGWQWGNGSVTTRSYDTDGRIASLSSAGQRAYTYYADGTIQSVTSDAQSVASALAGTTALAPAGSSNHLTGMTGPVTRSYSYDSAGHVIGDGVNTFTYNNAGRLASVTNAAGQTTYTYNALGQRVRKVSPSGTTYFVYDEAGHLIGEYDGNVNLIEEIVWLGDIPVASIRPSQSGGVGIFYIHTDHLNAPTKLTRADDNTIVWRWDHDPYGNGAVLEDPDGNGANVVFNLRFPGQYYDVETGLNYNWNRDYDPAAGRYIESDPLGLKAGVNTYVYVGGNPLSFVDKLGLEQICGAYFCGTTTPAYPGAPGYSEPPPRDCETCQGGDKLAININTTVCDFSDTSCFLAMQAAGIPGPYTPHTNYYSKTCLSSLALKVKATGAAAGEVFKKNAPTLLGRLGGSSATVANLSEFLEYTMGWEAFAVLSPLAIEELGDQCQCNK